MANDGPAILPVPDEVAAEHIQLPALPDNAPQDVVAVIETSGSTAKPKRVMLTARALRASAAATYERLDQLAAERGINVDEQFPTRQWLLCLPAHYVAGLQVLARSLQAGTRPDLYMADHFDVRYFEEMAAKMDGERRYVSLVPVQLQRLVEAVTNHEDFSFAERERISARMGRFDAILVGGQAVPPHIVKTAREFGWAVVLTYGSSETAGGCVYNGIPLRGVSARVEQGEIWLAGPMLAAGYLDDPERTAAAFAEADGQRWYRTNDAGEVEPPFDPTAPRGGESGQRVSVTGRLDNVINSGGIKVNLDEVERELHQLPGFENAVAVSLPSDEWGESVALVLPNRDAQEAELLIQATEQLAKLGPAARPVRCIQLDQLPRLASGKPDRVQIRRLVIDSTA
ncbi:AMP-binding protein [Gulosibacter chungangensis]|uniref:AMP-binding protein n=2 Tax=Gulosibacter chungangensis TaxID=979746 RepID=A0A7J5BGF8_9MICO|nr:AMP-binding protein [Gulosibacter chungangensis]